MKTTESTSLYDGLEHMSALEILRGINAEDTKVAKAVSIVIPKINIFVEALVARMKMGGRLFYLGAGTSGRLGTLDASECPPTFGVDHETVIGLIAGGDSAIRKAVEHAEDDWKGAWKDLLPYSLTQKDTVVGIAASGTTPYVIGGLEEAQKYGLLTACITCNEGAPIAKAAEHPIEVVVGPEFVTGSTRMKSGTAQKMVLNMISTSTMILLGKVEGNKMVDMQLSNDKLIIRGVKMLVNELKIKEVEAKALLMKYQSVRDAINSYKNEY